MPGGIGKRSDGDLFLRPFTGIVHEIAGHLFQVLPLAAEEQVRRTVDIDVDAALGVDAPQDTRQIVEDIAKLYKGSLTLGHARLGGLEAKLSLPAIA